MNRNPIFKRKFNFSLWGLIAYLLSLGVLCSLGVWQLNRAEQKKIYLDEQKQAAENDSIINLNQRPDVSLLNAKYQKVIVSGHYDQDHQFLLDNRIQDGKPGYWVFTPFLIDNSTQQAILVNRGWLPLGRDRNSLPDVSMNAKNIQITGRINQFPGVGLKLSGAEIPSESWPATVQVIDSQVLANKLAYPLADYQIELDADNPEGYSRKWQTITIIPPEKHIAYAVQWFGLALTLTAWFYWQSTRKQQ